MSNSPVETVAASGDKAKIAIAVFVVLLSIAGFYYFSDKSEFVRLMILLVGVIVGSIVFSLSSAGNKFLWFVKESVREAKKSSLAKSKRSFASYGGSIRFCINNGNFLVGRR